MSRLLDEAEHAMVRGRTREAADLLRAYAAKYRGKRSLGPKSRYGRLKRGIAERLQYGRSSHRLMLKRRAEGRPDYPYTYEDRVASDPDLWSGDPEAADYPEDYDWPRRGIRGLGADWSKSPESIPRREDVEVELRKEEESYSSTGYAYRAYFSDGTALLLGAETEEAARQQVLDSYPQAKITLKGSRLRGRGLGRAESSCDALPALLDRAEVAQESGDADGVRQALADYTDTRVKHRCKGPIPSRFFDLESGAGYSTVYGSGGQVLSRLRGTCEDAQREAARTLRAAKTPAQRRAAQKFMKRVKSQCGLGSLRGRRLRRKR